MERREPVFLSILLCFFLCVSISFSTPHQLQIFVPTNLPSPHTLSRPTQLDSETSVLPERESREHGILSVDLYSVASHAPTSNLTAVSLLESRLRRDIQRVQKIHAFAASAVVEHHSSEYNSSVFSGRSVGRGEYFTRIGFGTPVKYFDMVVDTGSGVSWLQCNPCKKCYRQTDPVFDPSKSSSFSKVLCGAQFCEHGCTKQHNNTCPYGVSYGDGSFTSGELSTETMTFRGNMVKRVAFGCGHDNEGLFTGAAGLLGLGRGKLSFTSQAASRFGKKFSYCLMDLSSGPSGPASKSSILFGKSAVSRKAVLTPLLTNPKIDTFYYLGLLGVSVGGQRVPIPPSVFKLKPRGSGGVIIDSGTTVTRLVQPAYEAMRDAFRTGSSHLRRSSSFFLFDTCFDFSGTTEVKVPTVVLHFTKANVSLPAENFLIPVDNNGTYCFAFAGTNSTIGLSIIGNIQQQGFRVSYDLESNRVGFAPGSCGN
ncbi:hypothetical protein OROGR_030148 [Orobanche gracilis]